MKSKRNFIIVLLIFFLTLSIIPSVFGKTRNAYLVNFIISNEIEGEGFSNAVTNNSKVSLEATAYALDILDHYGRNPDEKELLQEDLEARIEDMFDIDNVDLYDLSFLLRSLNSLDYSIEEDLMTKIYKYLNETEQSSGGFAISNDSTVVSLSSIYYVTQIYSLIDKPIQNKSNHIEWVLSTFNPDGGNGGNSTLSSTIPSTFYALSILIELGKLSAIPNITHTLNFIKSFYVENSADINNYGGFLPDYNAKHALLSSTYYCIKSISLIDDSELNQLETIKWLLSRQNFQDGGFADINEGFEQLASSITTSFYAFSTLKIFDPQLSRMSKDIWMVEFNYWILFIILGSIGLLIAIAVYWWHKRRI
ncbi:MAG: prenyltransferase/squalene oxidase repeat-containing protein [Promethearchaeota archaeon]